MTDKELARERRKQLRLEKLGTNEPRCGTCGDDRWQCIEAHHVAGQRYDGTEVLLCRNCHRLVSDDQCDHPRAAEPSDPALFAIGRFLLGLADLLRIIVERLLAFGQELTARAVRPAERRA
jgi:hypothetical protein